MHVSDFDFELPDRLIAQHPRPRGGSRLLVVNRATGTWEESRVADLARWMRSGDLLVANDSRVFPARLLGRRLPGGGHAECLLVEQDLDAPTNGTAPSPEIVWRSFSRADPAFNVEHWQALVRPGAKIQPGVRLDFSDEARAPGITLTADVLGIDESGQRLIRLTAGGAAVTEAINRLGHVPLPPYIHRPDTDEDRTRYQTIFARATGSIAAPTAGLHFDDDLLRALNTAGVERTTITLHVGYGTFKPVTVDDTVDHRVDAERWEVTPVAAAAIGRARARGGRIIAVGTTTTRALESTADAAGAVTAGSGRTDLCITPGYEFRAIDALLTNFHLPRSSLLMLVSAFAGRDLVMAAYRDAVTREFAFYSYGDAMLVL